MIRNPLPFAIANLVLFLGALGGSHAQDLPSGPTFRLTSRLVYVDVVVRNGSGQVVRGLTQEDFKIEEDGKPQKLDFFEAHSLDQASVTPVKRPAAAPEP